MNFFPQNQIDHPDGNGHFKNMRHLTALVAMSENRVIGIGGELPWNLPDDRKFFKKTTTTKPNSIVVMGRKTFEDIMNRLGKPLPGRKTIVLSRNSNYKVPLDCELHTSEKQILALARSTEIFIAGGEQIYKVFLPHITKLYITHVNTIITNGDAFFPVLSQKEWQVARLVEEHLHGQKNQYSFGIIEYSRVKPHHS